MTNNQSDELLREVLGELGQLRKLLDERLPQPVKLDDTPAGPSGVRQAVVTGEGSTAPPVARSAVKVTQKRR